MAGLMMKRPMATATVLSGALALGLSLVGGSSGAAVSAASISATRLGKGIVDPHPIAINGHLHRIFAVDGNNGAHAVNIRDAATGRLLGATSVGAAPIAVAVDERSNRVFVALRGAYGVEGPGSVSILDARTGRLIRTVAVGPNPQAMAIDERANRVFILNSGDLPTLIDGSVTMLDATSGRVLRTLARGSYPETAVVDARHGRVFIGNARVGAADGGELARGTVSVRETASSRLLQTLPGGSYPWALALDARTDHLFVTASSLLNAGSGARLWMRDAGTGALVRTANLGVDAIVDGIAVDGRTGRVVVTTNDNARLTGRLHLIDAASGRVVRSAAVGPLPALLAVADRTGRLIIGHSWYNNGTVSGPGNVSILDEANGRVLRSFDAEPWALTMDSATNRVFIVDADNNLSVLDIASGVMRAA